MDNVNIFNKGSEVSSHSSQRAKNMVSYDESELVEDLSATTTMIFSVGDYVYITKGKHTGKRGSITKVTPQKLKVEISDGLETGHIPKTSVLKENKTTNNTPVPRTNVIPDDDISFLTMNSLRKTQRKPVSVQSQVSHVPSQCTNPWSYNMVAYNENELAPDSSAAEFKVGDDVYITKGKYVRQQGIIIEVTPQKLKIQTREGVETGYIPKASVKMSNNKRKNTTNTLVPSTNDILDDEISFLTTNSSPRTLRKPISVQSQVSPLLPLHNTPNSSNVVPYNKNEVTPDSFAIDAGFKVGDDVFITKGKYGGHKGTIIKVTPQKLKVQTSEEVETGYIPKSSVLLISTILNWYGKS